MVKEGLFRLCYPEEAVRLSLFNVEDCTTYKMPFPRARVEVFGSGPALLFCYFEEAIRLSLSSVENRTNNT